MAALLADDARGFRATLTALGVAPGPRGPIPACSGVSGRPRAGDGGRRIGAGRCPAQRLALALPALAEEGLTRLPAGQALTRDLWEESFARVARASDSGIPIPPVDGLSRREIRPPGPGEIVQVRLNRERFKPGDRMELNLSNRLGETVFVEAFLIGSEGQIAPLTPGPRAIGPGESLRCPPAGQSGRHRGRPGAGRRLRQPRRVPGRRAARGLEGRPGPGSGRPPLLPAAEGRRPARGDG
ncbi:MAG: hypothetical protein WKF75_00020 [Singulisphaera sp.]